jgi:hypothetical protein
VSGIVKQVGSLVLLAGLIGAVVVLRSDSGGSKAEETDLSPEEALTRYGFYLREVSKECGIDFTHQAPTLDARVANIMPIINAMGASVSIVDFDRDGWPDIYVVNSAVGSRNRLYRNLGVDKSGKPLGFKDVAEEMGVADLNRPGTGVCMGAVWGDFDNDGYEDLLVYKWGRPELYRNLGKDKNGKPLGFRRVENAGLPKWVNANSAVWLDYNRDGYLDLFIAGYWSEKLDLWHLKTTRIMPESFEYAKNGGRKYLLRNRGKDRKTGRWLGFEDVTGAMGITSTRWTLAVAAGDLCGTGYPDLFLANDYGVSELYANKQGKEFVEISKESGIGARPKSGMNASFGDVYNNGRLSVYVSNITEPPNLIQGNNFWVPLEGTRGEDTRFENYANVLKVEKGGWSWGAQFGDLNNDGLLDLYLVNGYISADRKEDYWYDYSEVAVGNSAIIRDAARWPAIRNRSLSGYQPKCVWLNRNGSFIEVAQAIGVTDNYDGRAVALVDLWNRGVLDVVVANQKGPLLLYRNTVAKTNQWIQFELEGTRSNRSAIGAQVRLFWNGQEQVQEVSGGCGYAAQNMRRLHFGLGKDPRIDRMIIRWPSGRTETRRSLRAGQCYRVKEKS